MIVVIDADEAWWPPTFSPSMLSRRWFALCIIHIDSHKTFCSKECKTRSLSFLTGLIFEITSNYLLKGEQPLSRLCIARNLMSRSGLIIKLLEINKYLCRIFTSYGFTGGQSRVAGLVWISPAIARDCWSLCFDGCIIAITRC